MFTGASSIEAVSLSNRGRGYVAVGIKKVLNVQGGLMYRSDRLKRFCSIYNFNRMLEENWSNLIDFLLMLIIINYGKEKC